MHEESILLHNTRGFICSSSSAMMTDDQVDLVETDKGSRVTFALIIFKVLSSFPWAKVSCLHSLGERMSWEGV